MRITHQLPVIRARSERDSMLPQETVSMGSPMPRKLNVDSATMAERTFITTMNMMEERKFGARCCPRMWAKRPPMAREAITYSLPRSCRASVRTTFAMEYQEVRPMITAMDTGVATPQMACRNSTVSSSGTLSNISVRRIMALSTPGEETPLTAPYTTAMAVEIKVERKPMNSDTRPPCQMQRNRSRPMASVPKRNSPPGAWEVCSRSR